MKLFGSPWYIRDNLNVAFFVKKLSNLSWHLPQKRIAPLLYLVINMTDWLSKDCVEVAVSPSNSLGKAVKRLVPICIFTGCLVLLDLSQIAGCKGYPNKKWSEVLFFEHNQIKQNKFLKSWKMGKYIISLSILHILQFCSDLY